MDKHHKQRTFDHGANYQCFTPLNFRIKEKKRKEKKEKKKKESVCVLL
jgi:hypothetical protein